MFLRKGASFRSVSPLRCSTQRWSLKKGHVVGRGLDAQHEAELVVHLDGALAHGVADAGPLDAGAEVVADLVVIGRRQFAAQEGCHLVGLDAVNGRADDLIIEWLKLGLAVEQDALAYSACMMLQW